MQTGTIKFGTAQGRVLGAMGTSGSNRSLFYQKMGGKGREISKSFARSGQADAKSIGARVQKIVHQLLGEVAGRLST
ncbi:MAG: hypothetical protein CBB60_001320 [Armatimonadetes bacterium Cent15-Ar3]|nr:MAG: hypothetical protein CBB60_001320 [Armatimonadetes bacterium Cent15-Ar3]